MFVHGGTESAASEWKKNDDCEKNKKKKRFSDEQIRLLEETFERERRLEPRRKMEVAQELRLEPRQVAIWFQNKRARSKSSQLQRDYASLRANYDGLAREFQKTQNEHQNLLTQLQKLKTLPEKQQEAGNQKSQVTAVDREMEYRGKNRTGIETDRKAQSTGVMSDEESMKTTEELGFQATPNLLVEPAGYSLGSSDEWAELAQGWDFWS